MLAELARSRVSEQARLPEHVHDARVVGQSVQVAQGNPVRVWIPLAAVYSGALLARVVETAHSAVEPESVA